MSNSEGSASADSMEEDSTGVPRTRRSKVWLHYEKDLVLVDGDFKAVCKYCRGQLHTKFGTTSLRTHIAESCRSIDDDCRKRFLLTVKTKPSQGIFVFDPIVCRELMIKFCIHAEIPFLKFEDPYLQPWIDSMQPAFQLVGRHTIRDDAMKMYKGMKKDIEAELQNLNSRICLTSDMWTSSQSLGYMSITAHYELLAATSTAHSTPSSQGNTTIGSPIAGKRQLEEEFSQYKSRHVYTSPSLTYIWKKRVRRMVLTLMSWLGGRGMPKSFLYWHLWPVTFSQFP